MRVETPAGVIELGTVQAAPTIGIIDYSRRVTDAYGVTTVVERGFARRLSVRLAIASDAVDGIQEQLAQLRASVVTWTADDRFACMSVRGFLKEFAIDLPGATVSYCTLTVEGVVEPAAPAGGAGDPAPGTAPSTLRLIQPAPIGDAQLLAASVPEGDQPLWSPGTLYPAGARVMLAHRIFESVAAGNVGNEPAGSSGKWIDIGPTNRWAMFDRALGSATSAAGAIEVTIDAGAADAIALLDVVGTTARAIAAGYDRTVAIAGGSATFFDLPGGSVTVTIAGPGQVAVGTMLIGRLVALGITEAGAGAGIIDYSRKVVDDFGEVTLVERAWAKRMTARALIRTDALDLVAARIAAVRARPSLWIGQSGANSLTVYGFFKDFTLEVGETVSKLSLSIEGLSKATQLLDPDAAIDAVTARLDELRADIDALSGDGVITAGREKGRLVQDYLILVNWLAAIDDRYAALGSPADITDARAAAMNGRAILDDLLQTYVPAWNDLTTDTPVNHAELRSTWISADQAIATYAAAVTGRKGDTGESAPLVKIQWSINGVDGWHDNFFGADVYQRQSNDNGATWGPAYRVIGEAGTVGPDGTSPSIVFLRSPTLPETPADNSGNPPAGWSDGPPAGTDILWQSKATFRGATQLTNWSVPVRISGERGENAPLVRVQWSIDGVDGWHDYFFGADAFQRQSNDDGSTWGPAYRVIGEAGTVGPDGTSPSIVFTRSTTIPGAPADNSGNPPAGWSDGPPAGTEFLWQSKATFRGATQLTSWSEPVRISGNDGVNPISVSSQPETFTIQAGANGAPIAGELPKAIGNVATQAGAMVAITSVTILSMIACTAVVIGTDVRVTAVAGMGGEVVYDVVAAGQTQRKRVTFTVNLAGADGGRAQSLTISTPLSWSSYEQQGGSIAINASSSGKLSVNLSGNMRVALENGDLQFQSKVQYRAAGGAWVDVGGSEAVSTVSETLYEPTKVVGAQVNGAGPYSITGLAADAAYEVRAVTRFYRPSSLPEVTNLRLYAEQTL